VRKLVTDLHALPSRNLDCLETGFYFSSAARMGQFTQGRVLEAVKSSCDLALRGALLVLL
jgi:hypothetical protein